MNLHQQRLNTMFYVDDLYAKTTSVRGNNFAKVFTDNRLTKVYPTPGRTKLDAANALRAFIQDVGVPEVLTADLAPEMTNKDSDFMKLVRRHEIRMHWIEKGQHYQNHRVEQEIGILKQRWRNRAVDEQIPSRIWDYGLEYEAEILSRMSRGLDGQTGIEQLTGVTPDISEWLDFTFYDLV